MATKTKPGVDDQPQIPELQDEKDEKLIAAAKRYHSEHTKLVDASKNLDSAHEVVKKLMHERGITKYRYKKLSIEVVLKERVKVKTDAEEPSKNGDGAEAAEE